MVVALFKMALSLNMMIQRLIQKNVEHIIWGFIVYSGNILLLDDVNHKIKKGLTKTYTKMQSFCMQN